MALRNSLSEMNNALNENSTNRSKRKNEESALHKSNKKRCFKPNNQHNIADTVSSKNENFKKLKRAKSKVIHESKEQSNIELTPASTISSNCFRTTLEPITTLPNFDWTNSVLVWNMMLKSDQAFKRNSKLFDGHPTLQPVMRAMLLDWLNEVCQAYNLTRQTYYLALDFFDRYLSAKQDVSKKRLQLLGITCLFIAAKIEEIFPPKLDRFSFVCDGACTDAEILVKEVIVLNTLKWEVCSSTPIAWLNVFLQNYSSGDKENVENKQVGERFLRPDYESKLFVQIAHLIDLCTLNAGSLEFPYSVIAASAFYHFTNEEVVLRFTGKTMKEMSNCIEWMIPFAMAIKDEGLDFVNKLNLEDDPKCTTIQSHTVSLDLLKNAQAHQAEIESYRLNRLESDASSQSSSSLTPSKMPPTPPHST